MLYIGRVSDLNINDYYKDNNNKKYRRSQPGKISDFNFWDSPLSIDKMNDWTKCK